MDNKERRKTNLDGETVSWARLLFKSGRYKICQLARIFGVPWPTMGHAVHHETWKRLN